MKKYFKTSLIIVSIAFIFAFAGCQNNALTPQQVQKAAADINSLNDQAAAYQQQAVLIAKGLNDSNIVDANIMAKVNQLNAEADKVRAKIAVLTAALQAVQLTGDNNQDLLNLLQQLNAASSPFNPYAAPTAGVLGLIGLILAEIARRKAMQATQANKSLDEVVTANDIFLKAAAVDAVQKFKDAQNLIQTAETVQKVAAIKTS